MKTIKYLPLSLAIAACCVMMVSCTNKSNTTPQKIASADSTTSKATNSSSALSIYQLEGNWVTQDNKTITLSSLKGKPQVIAMVFTSCRYACPKITKDMQDIEKQLPFSIRNKVGFTLVSFDTERDTVGKLKAFANDMQLDSNWTLLHGNDEEVRELSLLLDVNYEKLPGGDFNHTSVITVLDKNGVIAQRHEGLEIVPKQMADKIETLVK